MALNYNPGVTDNDGSCIYACENEFSTIQINMYDSYGDGWNGNSLVVNGQTFTFNSGYFASGSLCIDSTNCIQVTCDGGSFSTRSFMDYI